jgi:hypothetical protein
MLPPRCLQVGLIVGKPSVGVRDLALAVVPTTSQDGEQVNSRLQTLSRF